MSAPEPGPPRGRYKARAAFGLAVALLGGSYMWASVNISSGPGYTAVGPGAFPLAIGAGLVLWLAVLHPGRQLAGAGISPWTICVEVTEGTLLGDTEAAA